MFVGKAEQIEESQKTSLVLSLDFELAAADASSLMFMTQHLLFSASREKAQSERKYVY